MQETVLNKATGQLGSSETEGWGLTGKVCLEQTHTSLINSLWDVFLFIVSLKCKIVILGRVPGFSPWDPVSQCSLLPGHLERKRSQDLVSVQMFNVYGNGFDGLQKLTTPPPFHSSGLIFSNSGVLFPVSYPALGKLAKKSPLLTSQHPMDSTQSVRPSAC